MEKCLPWPLQSMTLICGQQCVGSRGTYFYTNFWLNEIIILDFLMLTVSIIAFEFKDRNHILIIFYLVIYIMLALKQCKILTKYCYGRPLCLHSTKGAHIGLFANFIEIILQIKTKFLVETVCSYIYNGTNDNMVTLVV